MVLDLIVLLIVVYGFYLGYRRGLIQTVFDTLSIFIGLLAALKLSPIIINFLQQVIKVSPAIMFILGFIITFFLVLLIIRFIGKKLEDVFKYAKLNVINKASGGLIMGLAFAIMLSFVLMLMGKLQILSSQAKDESITYALLEPLPEKSSAFFDSIKPYFNEFWDKTVETLDKVKKKATEE